MDNHQKGLLLTALGVLIISPDALLLRVISLPAEQMVLWRGLLNILGFWLIVVARYRYQWWRSYLVCGRAGLGCALMFSLSTIGFILGNHFTKAGNVLVILASAPLIAALLSRLFLQERLPLRTWLAIGVCMLGISLIVLDDNGEGSLIGSAFALLAAVGLAGNLTLARSRPEIDMSPMLALSGLITAGLAWCWSGEILLPDAMDIGWLLLLCLVLMPAGFTLIQQGPQYLPSAEVSLLLLLETIFGTLLVWLFLSERPSNQGLLGGTIVLLAMLTKSGLDRRKQLVLRREARL
ncbi:drug/metabolite transporter (DMT)-like permease [Oceanisphaera litoralis]|uniref:DMT family transporter n=1 Tax=Oceanisphaera litoralis TaxID=225144 RepID=UPI0019572C5B|nr:DMT family transporter [Oceanisphaera litoralis]MBM7454802.1 drug/metabolite transporter (DMT)-like permease [Oceanisphaera litoralis]